MITPAGERPRPRKLLNSGASWLVAGTGYAECYTLPETFSIDLIS